jgi:hypothetical protein
MSRLARGARKEGVALAATVAALAAACGGCGGSAGMQPSAPAASPADSVAREPAKGAFPDEPKTIDEAREQIARAKAELESGARAKEEPRADDARPAGAAQPSTGAAPPREERKLAEAPTCRTPCQALRSMRRAVDALCRMTGSGDVRCTDAQRTLAASEQRVATCGC